MKTSYHCETAMTIFITRNNEQLGPFTLAQVQDMLASGAVTPTDLAWYEGLADWIPLGQMPALADAAAATPGSPDPVGPLPRRPIAVWIICLFYFACIPFAFLAQILLYLMANDMIPSLHLPDDQRQILASQTTIDHLIQAISMVLNIGWSVQFFRLKEQSISLFLSSIGLGVLAMGYHIILRGHIDATGIASMIILAVSWALNLTLLGYMIHLTRKGVLR